MTTTKKKEDGATPVKRLKLVREDVRNLGVQTGVRTAEGSFSNLSRTISASYSVSTSSAMSRRSLQSH